ncbi:hypothetical protein, partial, partial [Parasitella parasitica]
MNENENVSAYVERFEKKRTAYNNEIMKRKLLIAKAKNPPSSSEDKETIKQEIETDSNSDASIELIITEAGFMKCFMKGLLSKTLKREIKGHKFEKLDEILSWIKEMYDSEESDSSGDDNSNDSEAEDQTPQPK